MPSARRASAPEPGVASAADSTSALRILKKYPNRRLYDTQLSTYITLADVKAMVLTGEHFEVRDAKSGEDLTRSILLQIILEKNLQTFTDIQNRLAEQSKGLYDPAKQSPEMWTQFLNGQAPVVQGLMGNYLDQSRQMFLQMQEQMAKAGTLFPGMPGFTPPKR